MLGELFGFRYFPSHTVQIKELQGTAGHEEIQQLPVRPQPLQTKRHAYHFHQRGGVNLTDAIRRSGEDKAGVQRSHVRIEV